MKFIVIFLIIAGISASIFLYTKNQKAPLEVPGKEIRYVPIGDSYTIGESVSSAESYPQLLTNHLRKSGYNVKLVVNPAQSGWTTKDAIDNELPIFVNSKPDFATLLIGANDFAQGIDEGRFRNQFSTLLDRMLGVLPDRKSLVVITIPDFSVTDYGKTLSNITGLSEGISRFNTIIQEESKKRDVPVVDIFSLTQEMGTDTSLVSPDGLHPSAKEYLLWEERIYPVLLPIVNSKKL